MRTGLIFITFLCFIFNGHCQIANGNFESWPLELKDSPYQQDLLDLGVLNPQMALPDGWGQVNSPFAACRIENKCEGDYALLLFSWYNGEPGELQQTFSLTDRPLSLEGCYRYIYQDTAFSKIQKYVELRLWAKDHQIGSGYFVFDTSNNYINFEVPIQYDTEQIPDSISIRFFTDTALSFDFPADGLLFLDQIQLKYTSTNIQQTDQEIFQVYPNPFDSGLFIDYRAVDSFYFELFSLAGISQIAGNLSPGTNRIDLQDLPNGIFILHITQSNGNVLSRKFIKM